MFHRPFGHHGFEVSVLGLGAGPLGDERLDEAEVERLIRGALDLGVTLFDTAPSYGVSETRLGTYLTQDRKRVVLSTKLGYGVPAVPDWTGACIREGVDAALRKLRTDWLDVAHLHSCPPGTLEREDVLRALQDAVDSGKVRVAAYSGDGDGLRAARSLPVFGAFQFSHNLVDQEAAHEGWAEGAGTIGKRTLLNAAFALDAPPDERPDVQEYRRRWLAMPPSLREELVHEGVAEAALRFAVHSPNVCTCLVGTTRLGNLERNVRALDQGPLQPGLTERIRSWWQAHAWPGLI